MIEPVVCIRIELQELKAKIWRRVDVPLSATLAALHDVIQLTMGWTDSHLREFVVGDRIYGVQFRRPAEGAGRGVVRGLGGSVSGLPTRHGYLRCLRKIRQVAKVYSTV